MIENWKATATGAWSMWAFYLLLVLESVPTVLEALSPDLRPSDGAMTIVTIVAIACGAVARVLAQPKLGAEQ